jgi:hypothetical protein
LAILYYDGSVYAQRISIEWTLFKSPALSAQPTKHGPFRVFSLIITTR